MFPHGKNLNCNRSIHGLYLSAWVTKLCIPVYLEYESTWAVNIHSITCRCSDIACKGRCNRPLEGDFVCCMWLHCSLHLVTLRFLQVGDSCERRRYVPPKRRFLQDPRGVTSQNTSFFMVTVVKTSTLAEKSSFAGQPVHRIQFFPSTEKSLFV
jgi:hypothetical protein